ncbi:MAG: helix-turn-helix transcriptional regulator [Methanomicrobiaceae archaeon]|nr:helix-turn-helix transcriptional regulator [Methanomicrobiaceae archaeon]
MKEEEIFGKIIQEERIAKKISQEKLSKLTGLDRTFISLIENGKRNPTLSTILKISSALKISPSELFLKFEGRISDIGQKGGR